MSLVKCLIQIYFVYRRGGFDLVQIIGPVNRCQLTDRNHKRSTKKSVQTCLYEYDFSCNHVLIELCKKSSMLCPIGPSKKVKNHTHICSQTLRHHSNANCNQCVVWRNKHNELVDNNAAFLSLSLYIYYYFMILFTFFFFCSFNQKKFQLFPPF